MKKIKIIGITLGIVAITMISVGVQLQYNSGNVKVSKLDYKEVDVSSMAIATNLMDAKKLEVNSEVEQITPVEMETVPASIYIPPRVEVYEGMTLEELAAKLDRNLGSDVMAGKGYIIASKCLEMGVDPYVATAIILHETGCGSRCSNLCRSCNNVGGQKGAPGCNGGSYKAYPTLDDGIAGFISNLSRNYYSVGLNTVEKIAPKYAASSAWPGKINAYVNKIRNN